MIDKILESRQALKDKERTDAIQKEVEKTQKQKDFTKKIGTVCA
jgi:hypothetical protein